MATMEERLDAIVERYNTINDEMMKPNVVSDRKQMAKLGREQNELTPIVETYQEYKQARNEYADAKELAKEDDKELRELAHAEIERLEPAIQEYLDKLELLLVPKDPNDSHNAFMEIRGAAGGDHLADEHHRGDVADQIGQHLPVEQIAHMQQSHPVSAVDTTKHQQRYRIERVYRNIHRSKYCSSCDMPVEQPPATDEKQHGNSIVHQHHAPHHQRLFHRLHAFQPLCRIS